MNPNHEAKIAIEQLLRESPSMNWRSLGYERGIRAYEAAKDGLRAMVAEYNGPYGISCAGTLADTDTGLVVFLPEETAAKIYRDISNARN